jgi:hypothetical protein
MTLLNALVFGGSLQLLHVADGTDFGWVSVTPL